MAWLKPQRNHAGREAKCSLIKCSYQNSDFILLESGRIKAENHELEGFSNPVLKSTEHAQKRHAHSQRYWGTTKTWTIHAYDSAFRNMNLLMFTEVVDWEQFELTHVYLNLRQCLLTGFFGVAALDSKGVPKMWSWSCTLCGTQHNPQQSDKQIELLENRVEQNGPCWTRWSRGYVSCQVCWTRGFHDGTGCNLSQLKMMLRWHRASGGARSIEAPSCGSAGKGWAAFGNVAHSVSRGHQDADTQQGVQLWAVQSRIHRDLGEICLSIKANCLNLRAFCCTFQLCPADRGAMS